MAGGWAKLIVGTLLGSGVLWGAFEAYAGQALVERAVSSHEERLAETEDSVHVLEKIHVEQQARERMENEMFRELTSALKEISAK